MKKVFILCPASQYKHLKNTVPWNYWHLKICKIFHNLYKPFLFIIFEMLFNAVLLDIF